MVPVNPEDILYHRRLHTHAVKGDRVNRLAFMTGGNYDKELSVQLAKLLGSPRHCLRHRPSFGVGAITVADVERLGFSVVHDPPPDDPAHALVIGENSKQIASELVRHMEILISPEGA